MTKRFRSCSDPNPAYGGDDCEGDDYEIQYCTDGDCSGQNCYEIGQYPQDDISSIPLEDLNHSVEKCQEKCQELDNCVGFTMSSESEKCFLKSDEDDKQLTDKSDAKFISGPKKCPINGGWSEVLYWIPCKDGKEKGFKYCTNPEPSYGGHDCDGENFIIQDCNDTMDEGKFKVNIRSLGMMFFF